MKKLLSIIIFIGLIASQVGQLRGEEDINPFSKIIITSKSATCEKNKQTKNIMITYNDNVKVELADKSTILADSLTIILNDLPMGDNTTTQTKQEDDPMTNFEKIIFKGNIQLQQKNRTLQADLIEVLPKQKRCIISGNIKVEQLKSEDQDIPITAESNKAIINMNTNEITFLGSPHKPVSTTITIDSYPSLFKKIKTKEEKRAAKREVLLAKRKENKIKKKNKNNIQSA